MSSSFLRIFDFEVISVIFLPLRLYLTPDNPPPCSRCAHLVVHLEGAVPTSLKTSLKKLCTLKTAKPVSLKNAAHFFKRSYTCFRKEETASLRIQKSLSYQQNHTAKPTQFYAIYQTSRDVRSNNSLRS